MIDKKQCADIIFNDLHKLEVLLKYYNVYTDNSKFYYNNNFLYQNVYSIDVSSFNVVFLMTVNNIIKNEYLAYVINILQSLDKVDRIKQYGLILRHLKYDYNINLSQHLIGLRNYIFLPFFEYYKNSVKGTKILRINYDDMEFLSLVDQSDITSFINKKYNEYIKINIFPYVISLSKTNGIYYTNNDGFILKSKYCTNWVDIPVNHNLLNTISMFIINGDMSIVDLNQKLLDIIIYSTDEDFFIDDELLFQKYKKGDNIPFKYRKIFLSNIMSKFSPLFR